VKPIRGKEGKRRGSRPLLTPKKKVCLNAKRRAEPLTDDESKGKTDTALAHKGERKEESPKKITPQASLEKGPRNREKKNTTNLFCRKEEWKEKKEVTRSSGGELIEERCRGGEQTSRSNQRFSCDQ